MNDITSSKTGEEAIMKVANYGYGTKKVISPTGATGAGVVGGTTATGVSEITGKPLTQEERLSQGYANRAFEADTIINQLGSQFTGVSSYLGGILPNVLKSSERQQFEQAQRNFVNAVLRRESGAAIAESEFENARLQYFPQPGDNLDVLAQKARNRQIVIQSLQLSGGKLSNDDPLGIR